MSWSRLLHQFKYFPIPFTGLPLHLFHFCQNIWPCAALVYQRRDSVDESISLWGQRARGVNSLRQPTLWVTSVLICFPSIMELCDRLMGTSPAFLEELDLLLVLLSNLNLNLEFELLLTWEGQRIGSLFFLLREHLYVCIPQRFLVFVLPPRNRFQLSRVIFISVLSLHLLSFSSFLILCSSFLSWLSPMTKELF